MATVQQPLEKALDALAVRAARACVEIGLHGIEARVVGAFDISADMRPALASGRVHELATAALALALRFDDDGRVPVWTFDQDAWFQGELTRRDHVAFVTRHILPPPPTRDGREAHPTNFAPLIDKVGQQLFGERWAPGTPPPSGTDTGIFAEVPAFVVVFTSGDCADQAETEAILRYASHFPVFWQFAGVPGARPEPFGFLRRIDRLVGGYVDACGFFEPGDVEDMEGMFSGLLNEFPDWVATPRVRAMLAAEPAPEVADDPLELIMRLPESEAVRRELERREREERRAARAVAELQQAEAWPTGRAARDDAPAEPSAPPPPTREASRGARVRASTRPLAPSHWRIEAIRERPWDLDEKAPAEAAPSAPAAQAGDAGGLAETAADRLARIRARRQERRFPLPPPRQGGDR
jgi:hypothetical protein